MKNNKSNTLEEFDAKATPKMSQIVSGEMIEAKNWAIVSTMGKNKASSPAGVIVEFVLQDFGTSLAITTLVWFRKLY